MSILLVIVLASLSDPNPMCPRYEESEDSQWCNFWPKWEWLFGIRIPLVSFLDPVVSISEPVKLQSDNDADIANLKALWSCYIVLFNMTL